MKFTRVNLVEAIIFVLESCPNESFELKKLFNKVKKIIVFLPDEEVFKFQFVMTIKSLSKSKILNNVYRIHQYIISNKSYFSDVNVNYNNTANPELQLNLNNNILKKILIDIKTNNEIYDKLDRDIIFDTLIKSL